MHSERLISLPFHLLPLFFIFVACLIVTLVLYNNALRNPNEMEQLLFALKVKTPNDCYPNQETSH